MRQTKRFTQLIACTHIKEGSKVYLQHLLMEQAVLNFKPPEGCYVNLGG